MFGINWRKLKEALRPLPNIRVLENSEIQDFKEVSISAFSPTYFYYELERENETAYVTEFLQEMNANIFNSTQYNILLTHASSSLISLLRNQVNLLKTNPDLVVSGHMHNGLIPLFKNAGLISPSRELFPKYAHGVVEENETTVIINGAVNARVEVPTLNNFFKPEASIIILNPAPQKVKKK